MPIEESVEGSAYIYAPSKVAPVFFTLAFGASGLLHLWQCYYYKCFKLTILLPLACLMFATGFAVREYGAFDYGNLNVYIASTLLIYMAPPILELANYHILGRILYYVPYLSPIHPGRVLINFGSLSICIEVLNAIGVTLITDKTRPQSQIKVGHDVMMGSLVLQLVVISLLYVLAGYFQYRCAKAGIKLHRVRNSLLTLYISMLLILIRTIYRTIEQLDAASIPPASGESPRNLSPLIRHESFFYVFEGTVMLFNCVLWNSQHPRCYLPLNYETYLAQDGLTEVDGPGWKDKRPLIMRLLLPFLDPFGVIDCVTYEPTSFWETNGNGEEPLTVRMRSGPS